MKQAGLLLIFFLFCLILVSPAEAHPGNTAADGCHYCRTNCDKWGEVWNERHCHGGGNTLPPQAAQPAQEQVVEEEPVYTPPTSVPVKRVVAATAIPTRKPTNVPPTKKPTAKPTKIVTPTVTETPTASATPTMKKAQPAQRAINTQIENEKGFWYRFFSFLTGK